MPQVATILENGNVRITFNGEYDGQFLRATSDAGGGIWFGPPPDAASGMGAALSCCGITLKNRLVRMLVDQFGGERRLGGFSGQFYGLDAGPSASTPWVGFSEYNTFDGARSVIVATLYNEYAYTYNYTKWNAGLLPDGTLPDLTCYGDLLTGKNFVGNGNPVQWDSIFGFNSSSMWAKEGYELWNNMWSQGFMAPVDTYPYGVYYDEAFYLSGGIDGCQVPEEFRVNPELVTLKEQKRDQLFLPFADYNISGSDDDLFDGYAHFELFITYYGYSMVPEYIDFYPAGEAVVGPFWTGTVNCKEVIL